MKWFRANIGGGARLALAALALQFALAFGHFHGPAPLPSPILHASAVLGHLLGLSDSTVRTGDRSIPADDREQPADACAICAVMAMAQATLLSPPPALPLPEAVAFVSRLPDGQTLPLARAAVAFQPRGPPLS
jgi:hypothetical protein